ncbi:MAG TPA: 16S rRNA (adenine(1518)-N(6)/adenine(1519)-N(6))-dimethyltransferase RsmA [Ilumatobacteraceae bacterium]|nr:16S rRNA (adenine(1518)-N(6)/adenine(1519)-N(6))-dimethyltransferase RsmA [Ilumatobacteraceae bacterium]
MHSRAALAALLERVDRQPRRDLGQNFLADPNTARRITRLAGVGPGDQVIEIGAGLGSLTLALADAGASVRAIEVDPVLVSVLREVTAGLAVEVIEADATTVDWNAVATADRRWIVVANLPYNVATTLILDLLDDVPQVQRMLVMVQREVAERLCAKPRTKAYGAVTVKVDYWATGSIAGLVPASVFMPRPNVESALADIRRRPAPVVDTPPQAMFELVRTAFGQRRKMLRRSLAGIVEEAVFATSGIDGTRRPEELGVVEWGALTDAWLRR